MCVANLKINMPISISQVSRHCLLLTCLQFSCCRFVLSLSLLGGGRSQTCNKNALKRELYQWTEQTHALEGLFRARHVTAFSSLLLLCPHQAEGKCVYCCCQTLELIPSRLRHRVGGCLMQSVDLSGTANARCLIWKPSSPGRNVGATLWH